jgi:peroxiredoxin Q/BCP
MEPVVTSSRLRAARRDGTPRKLSEFLANGPGGACSSIPAAMTSGCTKRAVTSATSRAEFEARASARKVGISRDTVDKQQQFSGKHDFDYPLLADADATVGRMMGVRARRAAGPSAGRS